MASIQTGLLSTLVYKTYTDATELGQYLQRMGIVGLKDRIVGVYAVPTALISVSGGKISNRNANSTGLTIPRPSTIDGYTPKNKKLLTYPYLYATVACGNKEQLYVFEKSGVDAAHTLSFKIYGVMGQGFKIYILPKSYDHLPFNFNCAFEDDYPQLPVAITPFIELLGSNGLISRLMPLATYFTAMAMGAPMPMPAISGGAAAEEPIVKGENEVWNDYVERKKKIEAERASAREREAAYSAQVQSVNDYNAGLEKKLSIIDAVEYAAPNLYGAVNFNNIRYSRGDNDTALAITMNDTQGDGSRIKGVWGLVHSIRRRDAEAIDDFFTVYGYTCDKIKKPNTHVRTKFTYTKTRGCRIKPLAGGGGVAGGYMNKICSIFNNGITFWQKNATIGDYSGTNAIITP